MVGAPLFEIKGDTVLGFTANTLLGEHGQVIHATVNFIVFHVCSISKSKAVYT